MFFVIRETDKGNSSSIIKVRELKAKALAIKIHSKMMQMKILKKTNIVMRDVIVNMETREVRKAILIVEI